jgi:hypothetical protein
MWRLNTQCSAEPYKNHACVVPWLRFTEQRRRCHLPRFENILTLEMTCYFTKSHAAAWRKASLHIWSHNSRGYPSSPFRRTVGALPYPQCKSWPSRCLAQTATIPVLPTEHRSHSRFLVTFLTQYSYLTCNHNLMHYYILHISTLRVVVRVTTISRTMTVLTKSYRRTK